MTRRWGRSASAIGIVALLVSATACGKNDDPPPIWTEPARAKPPGLARAWVGSDVNEAVLIQVTQDGTEITGTLNTTELEADGTLDVDQGTFTGTVRNGSITMVFEVGFGAQRSLSGTVTSNEMILNAPSKSGSIATVTLRPGTIEEYNEQVANLGAIDSTGIDS